MQDKKSMKRISTIFTAIIKYDYHQTKNHPTKQDGQTLSYEKH